MSGPRRTHVPPAVALVASALAVSFAAPLSGCTKDPDKPIAGLLGAGAPLYMETKGGQKPISIGSQLMASDRVKASGPAVIEFFGGAIHFLDDGDELEIGDAQEAKLIGANVPARQLRQGALVELPPRQRIIAARYHSVQFTPDLPKGELTTGDYMKAFFTPNGIENLGSGPPPEGPRKALPPPPYREKVPRIHAGELGTGGARIAVDDEYVVAEADDLATAVLLEGQVYELGRTTRLLLPDGAEGTLTTADGRQVDLEGPMDLVLR